MPIKRPQLTDLQIQTSEDILYSLVDETNLGTVGTVIEGVDSAMRTKAKYDSDVQYYKREAEREMAEKAAADYKQFQSDLRVNVFDTLSGISEKEAAAAAPDIAGIEADYNALKTSPSLLHLQKRMQGIAARRSQSLYYTSEMAKIDRQNELRKFLAEFPDEGELIMGVASRFSSTDSLETAIAMSIETAKKIEAEAKGIEDNRLKWGEQAGMDMGEYYSDPEAWNAKFPHYTRRHAEQATAKINLEAAQRGDYYNQREWLRDARTVVPTLYTDLNKVLKGALNMDLDVANSYILAGKPIPNAPQIRTSDDLKAFVLEQATLLKMQNRALIGNPSVTDVQIDQAQAPFDEYVKVITDTLGTEVAKNTTSNTLEIATTATLMDYAEAPTILALQKLNADKSTNGGVQNIYGTAIQDFVAFNKANRKTTDDKYPTETDLPRRAADLGIPKEEVEPFLESEGKRYVNFFTSPDFSFQNPEEINMVVDSLVAYATDANRITRADGKSVQPEGRANIWLNLGSNDKFKTLYNNYLTEEQQGQLRPQLVEAARTELLYLSGKGTQEDLKKILNTRLDGWTLKFGRAKVRDPAQPDTLTSPLQRPNELPNTYPNPERHVQVRRLLKLEDKDGQIQYVVRGSDETGIELDSATATVMQSIADELNTTPTVQRMNKLGKLMDNVTPESNGRKQLIDGVQATVRRGE